MRKKGNGNEDKMALSDRDFELAEHQLSELDAALISVLEKGIELGWRKVRSNIFDPVPSRKPADEWVRTQAVEQMHRINETIRRRESANATNDVIGKHRVGAAPHRRSLQASFLL